MGRRNPRIAELRRLASQARERRARGRALLEGRVLLAEALAAGVVPESVFVAGDPIAALGGVDLPPRCAVHHITDDALESIGASVTPQPVVAVVEWPRRSLDDVLAAGGGPVVVAVGLADPGNAGTIIRTAEAAGAAGVVLTAGSVDPRSPKVVRAAAGSVLRLPVVDGLDIAEVFDALRGAGVEVVAADVAAEVSIWDADPGERFALVVGSEAHGLPDAVADRVDHAVRIPMDPAVESLNVGVSAAVILFEAARRRANAESNLNAPGAADNLTIT